MDHTKTLVSFMASAQDIATLKEIALGLGFRNRSELLRFLVERVAEGDIQIGRKTYANIQIKVKSEE